MIRCGCCQTEASTAGVICCRCAAWFWCHCGVKFCAAHQEELFRAHKRTCRRWVQEIG